MNHPYCKLGFVAPFDYQTEENRLYSCSTSCAVLLQIYLQDSSPFAKSHHITLCAVDISSTSTSPIASPTTSSIMVTATVIAYMVTSTVIMLMMRRLEVHGPKWGFLRCSGTFPCAALIVMIFAGLSPWPRRPDIGFSVFGLTL